MRTFFSSIRFYIVFMSLISLGFLLSTASALHFDLKMVFVLLGGGSIVGGTILFLEIYRNSSLHTGAENRGFSISNLPLNAMIFMGVLANFQNEMQEPLVFFMVGVYVFVFILGLVILQFLFKKQLSLK